MFKQKTYAFICLASLLLFFQSPISFISDCFFSFHIGEIENYSDLEHQENTNSLANPLEEEILHSAISLLHYNDVSIQTEKENGHYTFKLKTSYQKNTTPPPKNS